MPIDGPIPEVVFTLFAAATIFAVMFDLGMQIVPGEAGWAWRRVRLLLKALFAVQVAVSTGRPWTSSTVAWSSVAAWSVQFSIRSFPPSHSRTPSSDSVVRRYVPVAGGSSRPVHRAAKLPAPTGA